MSFNFTRRGAVLGGVALAACAPTGPVSPPIVVDRAPLTDDPRIGAIEQRIGGRVGVSAFNSANGAWLTHRARERFAMCSTFKWISAAIALNQRHVGGPQLSDHVRFDQSDLLDYAPAAREHVARGWMSVEQLCIAAVELSDNTAANLLLDLQGGPQGFTMFMRRHGDGETGLDRIEPALNENLPGDMRDTTTPHAMARTLHRFLAVDGVLNADDREMLAGWMIESTTGRERLRAGFPATWRVGDKTGTWNGAHNATNDVAIAWPPANSGRARAPIVVACYMSDSTAAPADRNAAHAEIARIVADTWS